MKSYSPKSVLECLGDALRSLETIVKGGVPAVSHSTQGSSRTSNVLRNMGKTPSTLMFKGDSSGEFRSWLFEVECYFSEHVLTKEEKYDLVVPCLKDHACLWHNTLKLSMMMRGNRKIRTWSELRGLMKERFLPFPVLNDLTLELRNLRQTSLNVNEYAKLFEELHIACDEGVDCVKKQVRFYHGLNTKISDQIELSMKYSFTEVYHLALHVEVSLGDKKIEVLDIASLIVMKDVHSESIDLNNVIFEGALCESRATCAKDLGLNLRVSDIDMDQVELPLWLVSNKGNAQENSVLSKGENLGLSTTHVMIKLGPLPILSFSIFALLSL